MPGSAEYDIGSLVALAANHYGDRDAIVTDTITVTFRSLHLRAMDVASRLVQHGVDFQDTVGILTSFGLCHIVAQLGVVYAGGTCLPLDPQSLDEDLKTQLQTANATCLLVDDSTKGRQLPVQSVASVDDMGVYNPGKVPQNVPVSVQPSYRSHILFTSGTTGTPKAVQVPATGIVRIARDPICKTFGGQDMVGHLNNPCFDVSLIDIWVSLINGTTIVVLDRRELLSPEVFAASFKRSRITYAFIPTALFHMIALPCPTAFSDFRTVLVGGEAPSVHACKTVLQNGPPGQLINGYGPAECTILALGHQVNPEDFKTDHIPMGEPLRQTLAYILDDALEPVTGEAEGELYLGGDGLSSGYLGNPAATQDAFVMVTGLSEEPIQLYRTGDLARRDSAGQMIWLGRKDREVKVAGYRVSLDVIEAEIMHTGLVNSAVAMKMDPPGSNTSVLVACFTWLPAKGGINNLRAAIKVRLPKYMVPQLVEFEEMPMTRHGKVDRQTTMKALMDKLQRRHFNKIDERPQDPNSTEAKLKSIWSQVLLTIPEDDIHSDTNFFDVGATSLQVPALMHAIYDIFGIRLPARAVYEQPSLRDLGQAIQAHGIKPSCDQNHEVDNIRQTLKHDATVLWKEIPIPQQPPVDWLSTEEGNVFLTGATGFIGAFSLVELLRMPQVKTIRCLVRADRTQTAFSKLFRNLAKYHLEKCLDNKMLRSKIVVVPGDLSQARLGLTDPDFAELAGWTSIVFHFAAQVNYVEPYAAARAANVLGTLNILRLVAEGKPKSLHYSSTISAYGPTGLIRNEVSLIREDERLAPQIEKVIPYEMGYGQSQWVADELIVNLLSRGFPVVVYRCGYVLCDSHSGVGNADDFVSRLLTDCIKLGIYPLLPGQREELIPVDFVASCIREIAMTKPIGRAYHIVPHINSSMDMNTLFELTGRSAGCKLSGVEYAYWVENLRAHLRDGGQLRLEPLLPMLEEKVLGDKTRVECYEGMARFKRDNTVGALREADKLELLDKSTVDESRLKAYVEFLRSQEY
ncbi:non-ribosomal peptide synthetase [Apiospora arundinis]|uniref:Non-ribosomal peptide synthetase n=1 Tax=Apiospora arundinis TaxID=335852 RepID=A0ABR2J4I6_9PEZI